MEIEVVVCGVNNTSCDIGTMVGNTLKIRQNIRPDKAHFNSALAVSHTLDMVSSQSLLYVVYNLLKRLNTARLFNIIVNEGLNCKLKDFADRRGNNRKFICRFLGENQLFIPQLLSGFNEIYGVVGNSFKIT